MSADSDDPPEAPVHRRRDTALRILQDHCLRRCDVQPARRFEEHRGVRLARKLHPLSIGAVERHIEQVTDSRGEQHPSRVAARRDQGGGDGPCPQSVQQPHRVRVGAYPHRIQLLVEEVLLPGGERLHGRCARTLGRSPLRCLRKGNPP